MPKSLTFFLFNTENLFLLSDNPLQPDDVLLTESEWQKKSISIYDNKPLRKLKDIQTLIKKYDPDVLLLCEVGGIESLENFNRLFLQSRYSPALLQGNSDRNIDLGFLIRKDRDFHFDVQTNKNRSLNFLYPHETPSVQPPSDPNEADANTNEVFLAHPQKSHLFSRDVAELRLFKDDVTKPFLLILLTHLKSRLDPDGIDPGGFLRRGAELKSLLGIYRELRSQSPQTPVLVAGDFNGNASSLSTDSEFQELHTTTDLKDIFDLAGLSPDQRATFYNVSRQKVQPLQLDYAFVSPACNVDSASVRTVPFLDPKGDPRSPPQTLREKGELPSDHQPIFFRLNFP